MARPSDPHAQLVYWCDCQAATLGHLCSLKRPSKSEVRRQRAITVGMLATTEALLVAVADQRLLKDLERVRQRCNDAIADGIAAGFIEED